MLDFARLIVDEFENNNQPYFFDEEHKEEMLLYLAAKNYVTLIG